MTYLRYKTGIAREDLIRQCLRELKLWPGCETVEGIAVLINDDGKFSVHVAEYQRASAKRIARLNAFSAKGLGTFT
jgi:hypothetical protein